MIFDRRFQYDVGIALDVGLKRRNRPNQDAIGVVLPRFISNRSPLFILADGMGGYEGGAIASKAVIKSAKHYYRKSKRVEYGNIIEAIIIHSHERVKKISNKRPMLKKMGSTIAIGIIQDSKLYFGNIGDSRIYVINPDEVKQVSQDQSVIGEKLRNGLISPKDALYHPKRSQLTMSISARREKVEPFLGSIELEDNDIVVFCSDGAWGTVTESQLQSIVLELSPQEAADRIIRIAHTNFGPDNVSVIIVRKKVFSYSFLEDDYGLD